MAAANASLGVRPQGGRRSFGLFSHDVRPSLNCRTHERTFFTSITPSLHVSLNCRWISIGFHATQVEESDNHALFFECKRRHFSIKNTIPTRPRHKHSTGSTVLPLGLAQPKEQPRFLPTTFTFLSASIPEKKIRIPYNLNAPRITLRCCVVKRG